MVYVVDGGWFVWWKVMLCVEVVVGVFVVEVCVFCIGLFY